MCNVWCCAAEGAHMSVLVNDASMNVIANDAIYQSFSVVLSCYTKCVMKDNYMWWLPSKLTLLREAANMWRI